MSRRSCSTALLSLSSSPPRSRLPRLLRTKTPSVTTTREATSIPERLSECPYQIIPCTWAKPRVSGSSSGWRCLYWRVGGEKRNLAFLLQLRFGAFDNIKTIGTICVWRYVCMIHNIRESAGIFRTIRLWFCGTRHCEVHWTPLLLLLPVRVPLLQFNSLQLHFDKVDGHILTSRLSPSLCS